MAGSKKQQKAKMAVNTSSRVTGSYVNPSSRTIVTGGRPQIKQLTNGVRVSNTEYFDNIITVSSGVRTYGRGTINPVSLVWLGNVAKLYSKYRIHSLVLSYVPQVGSQTSGFTDLGAFYDVEDSEYWFASGGPDTLYQCSEFSSGPVYAGGAVNTTTSKVSDTNWFGLKFDCAALHRTYPWFYVDPTSSTEVANLSKCASYAYACASTVVGTNARILVSYDIEFIQPTIALQKPTLVANFNDGRQWRQVGPNDWENVLNPDIHKPFDPEPPDSGIGGGVAL